MTRRNPNPPPPGPGRPKGSQNRSTANARQAIADFVEGNVERLQGFLDGIAETEGPKEAWRCMMDVLEYHIPKLARTELTGRDGGAIEFARPEDHTALDHYRAKLLASTQIPTEH